MLDSNTLAILSNLRALPASSGRFVLTRKFIDGMCAYAERWPGPVKAVLQAAERPSSNLDEVAVEHGDLPFALELVDYRSPATAARLNGCGVVLLSVSSDQNHLARECRRLGMPCVYVSEY